MKKSIVLLLLAVAASGCKPADKASSDVAEIAVPKDAAGFVNELKAAKLPVDQIRVVTAADDENELLGRPGQYTSKAIFIDTRHPKTGEDFDANENTVEVFATEEDAKKRHDYIAAVTKEMPMFTQYLVLDGKVLARFDKSLLPDEVKAYEAALKKLNRGS